MHDYRSNWNEPFSPLGPAIKPEKAVDPCPLQAFERGSFEVEPQEASVLAGAETQCISTVLFPANRVVYSGSSEFYHYDIEDAMRRLKALEEMCQKFCSTRVWNS